MHTLNATCVVCLAAALSAPASITITGRAVHADSSDPAAGLSVRVEHHENRRQATPDDFARMAATDAEGRFAVEVPSGEEQYMLFLADEAGHVFMGYTHLSGAKDADLGTLELRRGCGVSGLVKDASGNPVPGATVTAHLRLLKRSCHHYFEVASTTSADDGSFEFSDLSPGDYEVRSVADAYALEATRLTVGDEFNYIEHELARGGTIEGTVADEDGTPLEGALVRIGAERSAKTGADGQYVLSHVSAGRHYLAVRHPTHMLKNDRQPRVTSKPDTTVHEDITMVRVGGVELHLSAGKRTLPASVNVTRRSGGDRGSVSTTRSYDVSDRHVLLDRLPAGPVDLRVQVEGLQGHVEGVNVTPGITSVVEVALAPTVKVAGRVTGGGEPIQTAQVHVRYEDDPDPEPFRQSLFERTDESGRFAFELERAGACKLTVRHDDWMPVATNLTVDTNGVSNLLFALQEGLSISGTVVEADGSVPDSIEVFATGPQDGDHDARIWKHVDLGEGGAFHVAGLREGVYDLRVRNKDTREDLVELSDVQAGTDDVFVSLGRAYTVTIKVVGPGGTPLAGVDVHASRKREGRSFVVPSFSQEEGEPTGRDGRVPVALREGHAYVVTATHHPYLPARATVDVSDGEPSADEIVLQLQAGCRVRGSVVQSGSEAPLSGVRVRVAPESGPFMMFGGMAHVDEEDESIVTTDGEGRFVLEGVARGVASIQVLGEGSQPVVLAVGRVQARTNETASLRIAVELPGAVKGRVVGAGGAAVERCTLMLQRTGGGMPATRSEQAEEDGTFTFLDVAPGTYRLMWYVMADDQVMTPGIETVNVSSGETVDLQLGGAADEAGGVTVTGTVTRSGTVFGPGSLTLMPASDGASADAMMLAAQSAKRAQIESNGTFRVPAMEPGAYAYQVTVNPHGAEGPPTMFSGTVELAAAQSNLAIRIEGMTIKGTVTGADGTPLAEAHVMATPQDAHGMAQYLQVRYTATGEDGAYALECVPAGTYKLQVRHESGSVLRSNVAVSNTNRTVDFKLGAGSVLSGRVTREGGAAAPGAMVLVTAVDNESTAGFAMADADGAYKVEPALATGAYRIYLVKDGYAVEVREQTLSEDATVNAQLVPGGDLRVAVRGGDVEGTAIEVVAGDGEPVHRCAGDEWGMVGGPWSVLAAPVVGEDGGATIRALHPGTYTVSLEGSDATTTATVSALSETTVELSL